MRGDEVYLTRLDLKPRSVPRTAPAPDRVRAARDPRLDVFRGLCLIMIFINHVPGNSFEAFTSRNFGFSDAAEGFVMMSGIAAGLAYSADFRAPMRIWQGLGRIWGRCWTLYLVQMMVTVAALAIAAGAASATGDLRILFQNNMEWLWRNPVEALIGLPLMMLQFDYLNILPLYILLLLVSPLLLMVAQRAPWWLMAGSIAVWAYCGIEQVNLPNWPAGRTWFFNPLTWQAVFVSGLLIGVALKRGERLVPVHRWLLVLTGGFLLFSLTVSQWQAFADEFGHGMWVLKYKVGLPWIFTDFDKTFVTAPRLLHILALTYVVSALPALRRACASRFAAPLAILGRQSLPVFALGSVLAIGLQGVFNTLGHDPLREATLLGAGLALQLTLALARETWPKVPRPAR
ncbi:MAG: OpgC family protein [Cypionkella sp.]